MDPCRKHCSKQLSSLKNKNINLYLRNWQRNRRLQKIPSSIEEEKEKSCNIFYQQTGKDDQDS